ncbi:KR domain-containing protein [Phaeosphaeriaceae sp. PMI808]|nr:KR domain-containing protein [Phaeosphaeriaceae sp. PMI808]
MAVYDSVARVACINSPASVTVSGDTDAITKLEATLKESFPDMFFRKLQVDTAYHSHHMDLVAADYTKSLSSLKIPKPSTVRFHSSLLGRLASTAELGATYWVENLVCAVRFDEAIQSMCHSVCDEFKTGIDFITELSPHAALQGPIKQSLKHIGLASKIPYSSVLTRKKSALQTALGLVGTLFVKGVTLAIGEINFPKPLEKLPQNHASQFYHESRLTEIHKHHSAPRNDIIGVLAPCSNDFEPVWRNIVRLDDLPWLRHHRMQSVTVFPISGFVAMALEAIAQKAQWEDFQYDNFEVRNLDVTAPAVLTEEELEMTIILKRYSKVNENKISQNFCIRSWSKSAGWVQHYTGSVSIALIDKNEIDSTRVQQVQEKNPKSKILRVSEAATEPDLYLGSLPTTRRDGRFLRSSIPGPTTLPRFPNCCYCTTGVKSNSLSMFVLDRVGQAMISIENLTVSPIPETNVNPEAKIARELCYKLDWEPVPALSEVEIVGAKIPMFDAEIVIIRGKSDAQYTLASMLSKQLKCLTRRNTIISTLSYATPVAKDKLCIFLAELGEQLLPILDTSAFDSLQQLLTSVQGCLWIVHSAYAETQNLDANMITGLSRTLRSEGTLMNFITLDLETSKVNNRSGIVLTICDLFIRTLAVDSEIEGTEFAVRDGQLYTPRIINDDVLNRYVHDQTHPSSTEPTSFSSLRIPLRGSATAPGALESLVFEDDNNVHIPLLDDPVKIQVKTIGINAKDATSHTMIGIECSGIITAVRSMVTNLKIGDRVAAITPNGACSTVTRTPASLILKLPDHISFESGVTLPIAYCTAIYTLVEQAKAVEGETVLIRDGGTAVGQAALVIAHILDAQICVSVRSSNEKDLLMREFGISGQDMTWSCITNFGRFINVGTEHRSLDNVPIEKSITTLSANVAALLVHRPRLLQRILADVGRLMKYNKIQPIHNVKIYGISEAATTLYSAKTLSVCGRIVILPREDELVVHDQVDGRKRRKKYRTAIVLLSRTGALKGKAKEQIDKLNSSGSNIPVRRCDVTVRTQVEDLISGLNGLPPVRGIIHGAMVLHDVLFEKMTHGQYTSVVESKVKGTWNFHHALSNIPLDFFIVISSAAGAVATVVKLHTPQPIRSSTALPNTF